MIDTLEIKQLSDYDFEVSNYSDINCQVRFYNDSSNYNSVKGKGSRKYKELILQAINEYKNNKAQEKKKQQEALLKKRVQELKQSKEYENIDLLQLYDVTIVENDYYSNNYIERKSLLTGLEIKSDFYKVIEFKKHNINNTDIYRLGSDSYYERKALTDERIFIVGTAKTAYITGLTLKEMLFDGLKTYNNLHLVNGIELNTILNYGNSETNSFLITDFTNDNVKKEVQKRIKNELERAKNNQINITNERFTNDNKPIKKAFFANKPSNFEEVKNKHLASYDDYAIIQSITINKETFELFKQTLNMNILPKEVKNFKGGTSSTYENLPIKSDIFKNELIEQQNWINKSYRLVLEVKCNDYDYSMLIDTQGYNYPRYIAIKNN